MLTDIALKALKPAPKPYKRSDGGGLFIFVKPNGGKFWSLGCNVSGKQKFFSGGSYRAKLSQPVAAYHPISIPAVHSRTAANRQMPYVQIPSSQL